MDLDPRDFDSRDDDRQRGNDDTGHDDHDDGVTTGQSRDHDGDARSLGRGPSCIYRSASNM